MPYAGECNSFGGASLTGAGSVVYLANGMDVSFSRSLIDNDDGLLNFKVTSFSHLEGNAFTGVLDRMSDTGAAPGVVDPIE